jgi:hypothetical protein
MSEDAARDESEALDPEQFVQALIGDDGEVPELRVLTGFVGRSVSESHLRIYLDTSLTSFVEVRRADIRHAEKLPGGEERLPRTVVWIDGEATIYTVQAVHRNRSSMNWGQPGMMWRRRNMRGM